MLFEAALQRKGLEDDSVPGHVFDQSRSIRNRWSQSVSTKYAKNEANCACKGRVAEQVYWIMCAARTGEWTRHRGNWFARSDSELTGGFWGVSHGGCVGDEQLGPTVTQLRGICTTSQVLATPSSPSSRMLRTWNNQTEILAFYSFSSATPARKPSPRLRGFTVQGQQATGLPKGLY